MTTFQGGDGDDHFAGGADSDVADGGGGDDVLKGGDGDDQLQGGLGDDLLKGGSGADNLFDNSGQSSLFGGGGDDTISGQGLDGVFLLDGGAGADNISTFASREATLLGGAGDDVLGIDLSHTRRAVVDGGQGQDTAVVSFFDRTGPLHVRFGMDSDGVITARHGAIEISNAELTVVFLGNANDVAAVEGGRLDLVGEGGDDKLFGGAGVALLQGDDGNDVLKGKDGDDSLDGGAGNDRLIGGKGFDNAIFTTATAGVTVDLGIAGAQDTGTGMDSLVGIEGLRGSRFSDLLTGDKGDNFLRPGDLDTSQHAADTLVGGGGQDTLGSWAGAQDDVLSGGGGADTFVLFAPYALVAGARTHITDLSQQDTIDLSEIDADTGKAGDQAFHIVTALGGHAGEAALTYDAGARQTLLLLDADGDGSAEMTIVMDGLHATFDRFIL